MGRKGRRVVRNMYKGHMDKAKEGRMDSRRQEWVGQGGPVGENGDNYT